MARNDTLRHVGERLSASEEPLRDAWHLREELYSSWEEYARIFAQPTDMEERFYLVLIDNLERTKRANLERVVVKKRELDRVNESMPEVVREFEETRNPALMGHLEDLFYRLIHDDPFSTDTVRVPVWERAYSVPSPDQGKPDLVSVRAHDDERIIVSEGIARQSCLNFDLWVNHGDNRGWAVQAYLDRLGENGSVLTPCLIEKYAGAKGPILLRESFAQRRGSLLTYSQITRTVEGSVAPSETDGNVCIFADVLSTGKGLSHAKQDIEKQGYNVRKIVVLMRDPYEEHPPTSPSDTGFLYSGMPHRRLSRLSAKPIYDKGDLIGEMPIKFVSDTDGGQTQPQIQRDLSWWKEHKHRFVRDYQGMWIGVGGGRAIAAYSLDDLGRKADSEKVDISFTTYLEREDEYHAFAGHSESGVLCLS